MKKYIHILLIPLAFFTGVVLTLSTGLVFAHGGDTSLIHGCIRNNGLLAGFVRIIGANTNCANNETALDWTKEAGNNGLPFICPNCSLSSSGAMFTGKNLTNSYLISSGLDGLNLTGTIFVNANLSETGLNETNLTNTNFTNANLSGAVIYYANFSNANLTNANLTGASLFQSTGLETANLSGVIWESTICPDETNSNNNGGTCIGHLTP